MYRLKAKLTAEKGAVIVLRGCEAQIAKGIRTTLETDDPEGPHQLRIGLRRLRVALSFFRSAIDSHASRQLAQAAKSLAREAGRTRDLDVSHHLVATTLGDAEAAKQPAAAVIAALSSSAKEDRDRLRTILAGERGTSFFSALEMFIARRGWLVRVDIDQTERLAEKLGRLSRRSLEHRWEEAVKAAKGLSHHSVEERHDFRKELKKLRYAVEIAQPILRAKDAKKFLKRLKRLQDAYGLANDVAVVRRSLDFLVERDTVDAVSLDAVWPTFLVLEGAKSDELERAKTHWSALKVIRRPWA